MKKKFFVFIPTLFFSALCHSQNSYTGKFRVVGPNSSNAAVYENSLTITVSPDNAASISLHFRGGSRTEPEDYIDLSGTINGDVAGGQLDASGSVAAEMKDGSRVKQDQQGMTIIGTLNANKIEGKVYLGPIYEGAFFDFTATGSELKPALTYPVGSSPKVFNKGWVFGASFSITDDEGNEVDLSDKVEWSGTATFNPAKGKTSHPSFNIIGSNKIILTVKYEGNIYKGEYPVATVDVKKYAFQGCIAIVGADGHGCIACPHPAVGPILTGSPEILIEGYPAARVGDVGTHAACCDGNYYTITSGDDNVLINGKAAALFQFSQTKHCGGTGHVGDATQRNYRLSNKDVTINNKQADGETNLLTDDEVITGPKGLMSFSSGPQTIVTIFPSTSVKMLEDIPESMKLLIKYGAMMADGISVSEKKILIELKNLSVKPKGTKFYILTDSIRSTINVYHGKVTVTDKTSGISRDVDSGFSYRYENGKAEIVALDINEGQKMQRDLMSKVDNTTIKTVYSVNNETKEAAKNSILSWTTFFRENILYIAGGIAALAIILVLLVKKKRSKA